MRRFLPLAILAVLVLVAIFGWRLFRTDEGAPTGGPGAGGPPGAMALAVETVTLQPEPLQQGLRTVGTLRADESVVVRPEIAGRLVGIHFAEGERIAAGAPLFTLDASVARAALNEAQANLDKAQRADARANELATRQLIAKSDLDTVRAELGVTRARVASARAQLDKSTIHAPFDGVLGLREVSVGEFVNPGQALVSLVRLDPIEVDFSLPESELARLAPGQPVTIAVDAYAGREFVGAVKAIDPAIDIASRSARLRASIPNPDLALRPGLFARVSLDRGNDSGEALLLPEEALLQQGDLRFVYRVVDGKAVRTPVETGRRVPGRIEIVAGLEPGAEVVTAGQSKPMMFDGAAVRVIGAEAAPAVASPASREATTAQDG
jgi:membrane fusion protein (multidrug efflux system)